MTMYRVKFSKIFFVITFTTFVISSKLIFDKINITSNIIIDEEFHLQLGEAYCKYDFDKWHPKITTFPGLYILSSLLFGAFDLCTTYWLRSTSLLFSFINLILFYWLFNLNNEGPPWKNMIYALNLAIVPPLYFFSHLYYTDVSSMTMILILFLLFHRNYHYFASIFGMLAVLFRQTNIVWVAMVLACYVLQELFIIHHKKPKRGRSQEMTMKEFMHLLRIVTKKFRATVRQLTLHFCLNVVAYVILLLVFFMFVFLNGSIVVGDKSAHTVSVHIPQMFYFSIFCFIFSWPHFIFEFSSFLRFLVKHKFYCFCMLMACVFIVHVNTLEHPYLLSDNRHYVFYIWNRFYRRYDWFRYCIVPVYLFSWFVIIKKFIDNRDLAFLLFFIPCTFVVLVTQKLIELRYFFIPYVLFRLRLKNLPISALCYEFLSLFVINVVTLYVFFTKVIIWDDYNYPQRLIW